MENNFHFNFIYFVFCLKKSYIDSKNITISIRKYISRNVNEDMTLAVTPHIKEVQGSSLLSLGPFCVDLACSPLVCVGSLCVLYSKTGLHLFYFLNLFVELFHHVNVFTSQHDIHHITHHRQKGYAIRVCTIPANSPGARHKIPAP